MLKVVLLHCVLYSFKEIPFPVFQLPHSSLVSKSPCGIMTLYNLFPMSLNGTCDNEEIKSRDFVILYGKGIFAEVTEVPS